MLTRRGCVLICPVNRNNLYSLLLCNLRFTPVISFLHKYSYSSSHSIAYNLMGSSKFLWSLLLHLKIQVNFAFSPIYSYLLSYKNVLLVASENTKKRFGKIGIPERSTFILWLWVCLLAYCHVFPEIIYHFHTYILPFFFFHHVQFRDFILGKLKSTHSFNHFLLSHSSNKLLQEDKTDF